MRGKVTFSNFPRDSLEDHPRLCGEKASTNSLKSAASGITPAYAGKRLQMKVTLLPVRDHPRLCGEKF